MCFKACGGLPRRAAMALLGMIVATSATAQVVSPGGLQFYGSTVVRESFPSTAPVVQLTCNVNSATGLRADGTVVAWGDNYNNRSTPPPGLIDAVQIASGFGHTLALRSNGTVVAWGLNDEGQCNIPAGLSGVKSVWAGDKQSFAILGDGSFAYWGNGYAPPPGIGPVKQISAGESFAYALRTDGTLVGWGANGFGQLNMPAGLNNVVQIVCNRYRSMALKADGTVVAWGSNFVGESVVPSGLSGVKRLAGGYSHSLALKQDGTLVGWGQSGQGQATPPASAVGAVDIAANYSFSLALMPDGKVIGFGLGNWNQTIAPNFIGASRFSGQGGTVAGVSTEGKPLYWGYNDFGQANIPPSLDNVVSVSMGFRHGMALKSNGQVVCWGNNSDGQGSVPGAATNATQISAGAYHSAILRSPADLWCFGWNQAGQVSIPSGLGNILQVVCNYSDTAVVKADGTVVVWGENWSGERNVPAGLSNVISLAGSFGHFLALKSDGTVANWGWGTSTSLKPPVGISNAVQVATGDYHEAVLKADGSVLAWGSDSAGSINQLAGVSNVANLMASGNMTICEMKMHVAVAPWQVMGGNSVMGTVYLANPAPAGGRTVALSTSDSYATVPTNVVIPAGTRSADFTVSTTNPSVQTKIAVIATLGTLTQKSLLTIVPSPMSLTLSKPTLVGGSAGPLKGTITLLNPAPAGGATVNVTSSSATCTVPATVFIPAGKVTKDFTIAHSRVDTNTNATIDINYGALSASATVTLTPFLITNFSVDSVFLLGTGSSPASVTLSAPPATAMAVPITSTNTGAIADTVIMVPAGEKKGVGTILTSGVSAIANLTLTATMGNSAAKAIKVYPALTSVKFDTGNLYGNGSIGCTVTIPIAAPAGGWTVGLMGSNCQVPAMVVVPAGSTTVTFPVIANDVVETVIASVTASAGGVTATATRSVSRNLIQTFTVDPMTFVGGSATAVTGTITLVAPVAVDTVIPVSVSIAAIGAPTSVTVLAGQSSVTFPITHSAVTSPKSAKVTATRLGIAVKVTLTVN